MSRFIINYRNALKRMVVLYDMVMLADFLQPNTKIIITLNCKDFISMVLTCENLYIINESGDFALAKSPLSPNPMLKEGLAHHKE